jgi:hypothetical protein
MPDVVSWGPYRNKFDARHHIGSFTDALLGPAPGIVWTDGQGAALLRPPQYDGSGHGITIITSWAGPVPPPPPPPPSEGWLMDAFAALGNAKIQEARENAAAARQWADEIDKVLHNEWFMTNVSTGLDAVGVVGGAAVVFAAVAGGAAIAPIALVAATVAGVASALLLAADGQLAWALDTGDEKAAEEVKASSYFKLVELVGPILMLPDLALSGPAAVREVMSLGKEMRMANAEVQDARRAAAAADRLSQNAAATGGSPTTLTKLSNLANQRHQSLLEMERKAAIASSTLHWAFKLLGAAAEGGTVIGTANYGLNPPDLLVDALKKKQMGAFCRVDGTDGNPWTLLAPQYDNFGVDYDHHIDFRVAVTSRPEPSRP